MADDGASPSQVAIGAARSDNVSLLREVVESSGVAFVSEARDAIGNTLLQVACRHGSLECVDYLLDRDGLDVDAANRLDGDTALHLACRYAKNENRGIGAEIGV